MVAICSHQFIFISSILCLSLVGSTCLCIVVDGDKKKDVSAEKGQASEKKMIDSFNTKSCGIFDTNYFEHEFLNMGREGQFPWLVSFQIRATVEEAAQVSGKSIAQGPKRNGSKHGGKDAKINPDDTHFCCGSFISDRWILSAAHCFAGDMIKSYIEQGRITAVAGSPKVSSRSKLNNKIKIKQVFHHSNFSMMVPVGFDVALVELDEPVKFSQKRRVNSIGKQVGPFLNTICLPIEGKQYKFNETARIAGWGLSSDEDETSMPSKVLTTDILISDVDKCADQYAESLKSDHPKSQRERHNDFICASYKNTRDACQSDSGGPLMQYADGKAVVIGIVSYGIGCATKGVPGVYTRTSAYIDWIKDITLHGKNATTKFTLIQNES